MENLKRFAFDYLSDWYEYDRRFVADLKPGNSRDARLRCMREAAVYYRIARNFKKLPDEVRFANALRSLDELVDSITFKNVDAIVSELAEAFRSAYGKNAISAASKFLWIRHQSPVVIYDSNAFRALNKESKRKIRQWDYANFRAVWNAQFIKREDSIRSACTELVSVKDFSVAHAMTDDALNCVVREKWFRERVFDKFLWNAGLP